MKGLTIGVMFLLPIVLTCLLWYQPILIWKFQQSSNLIMFCFMFSFWSQIIPMKKPDNKPISTLIMNACTLQSDLFITYDFVPNFCHLLCSFCFSIKNSYLLVLSNNKHKISNKILNAFFGKKIQLMSQYKILLANE